MRLRTLENASLLLLVGFATIAFFWVVQDFVQPLFWAVVLAILFDPLQKLYLRRCGGRASLAAGLSVVTIVLIVIVPLFAVAALVTREAARLYRSLREGTLDIEGPVQWIQETLPKVAEELERFGIDFERLQQGASAAAVSASRWLGERAIQVGQNALHAALLFSLMLYVLFFFLRDGDAMVDSVTRRFPLGGGRGGFLLGRFAEVSRATIKGTLVVGGVQGSLGGILFWVLGLPAPALLGVVMIVLSLVPAVGASLVWVPTALVLGLQGDWLKAFIVIGAGTLVIGMVDNVLRPILVGRDTKLPDYLVLLSTLGGLSLMGLSGFVVGPVIAAFFLAAWEMFEREIEESTEETTSGA